jgi:hypothetical protein
MTKHDSPATSRKLVRDPSLARIDQAAHAILDLPTDRERRWALELVCEQAPELFRVTDPLAVPDGRAREGVRP